MKEGIKTISSEGRGNPWDMSPETRKEKGKYYVTDSYIEDSDGNMDEIIYREVPKDEYRAAKKQARRDSREAWREEFRDFHRASIELIRKAFKRLPRRRGKDGEN